MRLFFSLYPNYFKWEQYWHKIVCCCRSQNVSRVDLEINFPYRSTHQRAVWRTFKCSPREKIYLIRRPTYLWCLFSDAKENAAYLISFISFSVFKIIITIFQSASSTEPGDCLYWMGGLRVCPTTTKQTKTKQNKWEKQNRAQLFPPKWLYALGGQHKCSEEETVRHRTRNLQDQIKC